MGVIVRGLGFRVSGSGFLGQRGEGLGKSRVEI